MKNKTNVIVIDFDGTIASLSFPKVGNIFKTSKKYINKLYKNNTIVINTCRSGIYEGMAQKKLEEWGVKYDWLNCNPPELIEEFGQDCRKLSAHNGYYIDDKCLMGLPMKNGEVNWKKIYKLLNEKGIY